MGFKATSSDPCIYVKGTNMKVLYVDTCILISQNEIESDTTFDDQNAINCETKNEGTTEEDLGILNSDGTFHMSQTHIIDRIINSVPSMKDARSSPTPATICTILTNNCDGDNSKE